MKRMPLMRVPTHIFISMGSTVNFIFYFFSKLYFCLHVMEKMNESDNMGGGDVKLVQL